MVRFWQINPPEFYLHFHKLHEHTQEELIHSISTRLFKLCSAKKLAKSSGHLLQNTGARHTPNGLKGSSFNTNSHKYGLASCSSSVFQDQTLKWWMSIGRPSQYIHTSVPGHGVCFCTLRFTETLNRSSAKCIPYEPAHSFGPVLFEARQTRESIGPHHKQHAEQTTTEQTQSWAGLVWKNTTLLFNYSPKPIPRSLLRYYKQRSRLGTNSHLRKHTECNIWQGLNHCILMNTRQKYSSK